MGERVPCFVAGNEPAQMAGLYYNNLAPKIAYGFADNKPLNFLVNAGRVLTLRPPLKRGQFHALATMKQLAYGRNFFVKAAGYKNELVDNVTAALHEVPSLLKPLKRSIRFSSLTGRIPAFLQLDFNEISGGNYDWERVKNTIREECGWSPPDDEGKGLHTSCKIERCKENSQFKRFYYMKSAMIPFSAIEICLSVRDKNVSPESAAREIEKSGLTLKDVEECALMREFTK